jgi:hypothetical protein
VSFDRRNEAESGEKGEELATNLRFLLLESLKNARIKRLRVGTNARRCRVSRNGSSTVTGSARGGGRTGGAKRRSAGRDGRERRIGQGCGRGRDRWRGHRRRSVAESATVAEEPLAAESRRSCPVEFLHRSGRHRSRRVVTSSVRNLRLRDNPETGVA